LINRICEEVASVETKAEVCDFSEVIEKKFKVDDPILGLSYL
jgi:hypothetical protein